MDEKFQDAKLKIFKHLSLKKMKLMTTAIDLPAKVFYFFTWYEMPLKDKNEIIVETDWRVKNNQMMKRI